MKYYALRYFIEHIQSTLYFWDKRQQTIGTLHVTHTYADHFTFSYLDKSFSCSYKYAESKLFDNPNDVPAPEWWREKQRSELRAERMVKEAKRIKKQKAIEQAQSKDRQEKLNAYTPSPDVMVVYGD